MLLADQLSVNLVLGLHDVLDASSLYVDLNHIPVVADKDKLLYHVLHGLEPHELGVVVVTHPDPQGVKLLADVEASHSVLDVAGAGGTSGGQSQRSFEVQRSVPASTFQLQQDIVGCSHGETHAVQHRGRVAWKKMNL